MATSVSYVSAGQQGPFAYGVIDLIEGTPTTDQVRVFVDNVLVTNGVDYTIDEGQEAVWFCAGCQPTSGQTIEIRRFLDYDRIYSYVSGDSLKAEELNANYDHLRLLAESLVDFSGSPPATRPATNLFELADVYSAVPPSDGDILSWNESQSRWEARPFSASLASLSDTEAGPFLDGEMLVYNTLSSQWQGVAWQDFRPTEQTQLWGSTSAAVGFLARPYVSSPALSTPPTPLEIPTVQDVEDMIDAAQVFSAGSGISKRTLDALALLKDSPLEAGLLAAIEWKYGIRFASWSDYEKAVEDWPQLNGPVAVGDKLPDGADAIVVTGALNPSETGGPVFTKNPNRRFLPARYGGRVVGSLTIDPGSYIAYPGQTSTIQSQDLWVRNMGGLIEEVTVRSWRTNAQGDHVLTIGVELATAQSTQGIQVLTDRQGLLPRISDGSGVQGNLGIYNVIPRQFDMNIPTAWFYDGTYAPLNLRIYGDLSLDNTINSTATNTV